MTEKVLYVMQGVPGSGKSTIARMIEEYERAHGSRPDELLPVVVTISTDDHRLESQRVCSIHGHIGANTSCPECGNAVSVTETDVYVFDAADNARVYVFDAADNARFHKATQRDCARHMINGVPAIIVDNTNIQEWQAHPYLVLADIYGYEVQVVSVDCGLARAIERQSERVGLGDRAVPANVIAGMYEGMERLLSQPMYKPEPSAE